ncbi:MAG: 4Fe-4S dicluster domain-containing protein [Thermodesulfobacteriota bacterium]
MDIKESQSLRDTLLKEIIKCRACRFCIDVCPTYQASEWNENMSPYGRLQILKYLIDGMLDEDDPLIYSIYSCLQCGRCDRLCQAKGQNLDVSHLIRMGKYLLSQGLVKKGSNNEKI